MGKKTKIDELLLDYNSRISQIRLIDNEGTMIGIKNKSDALDLAKKINLSIIIVSPEANPPVGRMLDYGKYKYERKKKESIARKNSKSNEIKEIKVRPNIDTHDYETKMRNARKFFNTGAAVKFSMRLRGREIAHKDIASNLFNKIITDMEDVAHIDIPPKLDGRQMFAKLSPRN